MIEHERESADAFGSPVGGAIGTRDGGVVLDTFAGRVHVEWEPAAPVTALGQLPFFVEFLKPFRQLGGGLSPALYQPECAEEARRAGNDGAVDPGRPPLTSRRCAAMASTRACWGWSERRRGAPCLEEDAGNRRGGLAAPSSRRDAVAGGSVDSGRGCHGQAAVRPPGRSGL